MPQKEFRKWSSAAKREQRRDRIKVTKASKKRQLNTLGRWHLCRSKSPRDVLNSKTRRQNNAKQMPHNVPQKFEVFFSCLRLFHWHLSKCSPAISTTHKNYFSPLRVYRLGQAKRMKRTPLDDLLLRHPDGPETT